MIKLSSCAAIADLERRARARLPEFVFSYLAGGAGEDAGVVRNEAAMREVVLRARRLTGAAGSPAVTLFGKRYAQPFGIAPVGICNAAWPKTDQALMRLARDKEIPYVLSTAGSSSVEEAAATAPEMAWFQLYMARDTEITLDLLKRAADAGIEVLVFTVDVPGPARRNRAMRAGFTMTVNWNPKNILGLSLHPFWSLATFFHGAPYLANFQKYSTKGRENIAHVSRNGLSWEDFELVRGAWKGKLIVKGVLEPSDATEMIARGADGVWVSNHGGRQLEAAPAPISVLPAIRAAVGPSVPVLFDGGVRSGEDVMKAKALGADMVFSGRCFAYGAAAGAEAGVRKAYEILAAEVMACLTQTGCPSAEQMDASWVFASPSVPADLERASVRPQPRVHESA